MNKLTCENCCYFWQEGDENHQYCHFERLFANDYAPCEYEQFENEQDDYYDFDEDCDY